MSFVSIVRSLAGLPATPSEDRAPPFASLYANSAGEAGGDEAATGDWEDVIRRFQRRRNSHVIGLIHRHLDPREHPEAWYFDAAIGDNHAQDFVTALRGVPGGARLDVVLHSIGASRPYAAQQIARAIKAHKGETTVFVPYYAQGTSTLIALAGDRIVMGPTASLSYLEFGNFERVIREKGIKRAHDFTVMLLQYERMFEAELKRFACEVAHGGGHGEACGVARNLIGTALGNPVTPARAKSIGLPVTTETPAEVFALIRACRATPLRDHGVKVAERLATSHHAAAEANVQDVPHGWYRRLDAEAPRWRQHETLRRPIQRAHGTHDDDDEDEGGGVALENCDITVRPLIARMEAARGSRVICIVHQRGMESDSVDTVTTEDILAALQVTPPNKPLDVILHTPGGMSFNAKQISTALKSHPGPKTVLVPHYAMSAGTIIALAADQIILAPHAILGPIDAQYTVFSPPFFGYFPSRAIVSLYETKPKKHIYDDLLDLGRRAQASIAQDHKDALELMRGVYSTAVANRIAHTLNDGNLTHGHPVTAAAATALGLKVSNAMPTEAFDIVRAFRRSRVGKRSVIYCV